MDEKNEDKDKCREKIRKKRNLGWTGFSKGSINLGSASDSRGNTGGYDSHNIGGHTVHHGDGTATTTDNRGSIRHYSDGGSPSGSGIHWGGGSGSSSHGHHGGDLITQAEKAEIEAIIANIIAKDQRARTILKQGSSLAIIGGALTPTGQMAPVFSVSGVGSMALTDAIGTSLLAELSSAINSLSTVAATASNVAFNALSRGFVVASIFHSPEVGKDSDLAHGRTLEQFLSLSVPAKTMGLNNNALKQAAKTSSGIAMSVRGKLAVTEKKVDINVVKTPISQSVRVVEAKMVASGDDLSLPVSTGITQNLFSQSFSAIYVTTF